MRTNYKLSNLVILVLILNSCATLKLQVDEAAVTAFPEEKEIEHSFYFLGDGGNSPIGDNTSAIKDFQIALDKASKNSTAIFLGDNVYDTGFPEKKNNDRALAEHRLQVQIDAAKNFKGNTIFIPGNHDWYSGLEGLKRQEKFVEDALGKNTFLPENGCPIEKIDIADDIVLIVVDAHWYIMDWDKHPKINDDCEIKTREKFFDELESQIKKARGKTTLIALHHPLFTNGSHGGQYSFASHLKPLPVLGTLKNLLRETSGVANVDVQNKLYRTFRKRVITLAQENDKAIFVSGHDHSLQYIVQDNLPQIVSGSGSKVSATRNVGGGQFSYGSNGYTRLDVFKDGSSHVQFYSSEDKAIVFQTEVH
jgi:predicted phosphodiesterase